MSITTFIRELIEGDQSNFEFAVATTRYGLNEDEKEIVRKLARLEITKCEDKNSSTYIRWQTLLAYLDNLG